MEKLVQVQSINDIDSLRLVLTGLLLQIYLKFSSFLRSDEPTHLPEPELIEVDYRVLYPHLFAFDTLLSVSSRSQDKQIVVT